jgi:hypothetical protein
VCWLAGWLQDAFASGATPSISRSSGQALRKASGASAGGAGAGGGGNDDGDEEEDAEGATSALRRPAGGSSDSLAGDGLLLAPSGSMEWLAELNLVVDEGASGEGQPVRVQLLLRPPQLPSSPFESRSNSMGLDLARRAAAHASSAATPHPSAASLHTPPEEQAAAAGAAGAAAAGAAGGSGGDGSPREAAVREALLVQQFLDGNPSQLTYHGLTALQDGLRPNQLAVFFR